MVRTAHIFAAALLLVALASAVSARRDIVNELTTKLRDADAKTGGGASIVAPSDPEIFTVRTQKDGYVVDEVSTRKIYRAVNNMVRTLRDSDADRKTGGGARSIYRIDSVQFKDNLGLEHQQYKISQVDNAIADSDKRERLHQMISQLRDADRKTGGGAFMVDPETFTKNGETLQRFVVDPLKELGEADHSKTTQSIVDRLRDTDRKTGGGAFAVISATPNGKLEFTVEDLEALRRSARDQLRGNPTTSVADTDRKTGGGARSTIVRVLPVEASVDGVRQEEFIVEELMS